MMKRVIVGVVFGLGVGLAAMARATVACGSYDTSQLAIEGVKKDGVAQPRPTISTPLELTSSGFGPGSLYDPVAGAVVRIEVAQ